MAPTESPANTEERIWGTPYDLEAIQLQARLIAEVVRIVKPQVEDVITEELAATTKRVYITGCGDSHYAGLSSRLYFDLYSGVAVEPVESLEYSRYLVDFVPDASLAIGISNSGAVSRTIETLLLSGRRGLRTIAITGAADSALAKASDAVLVQTVPELAREERNPFAGGVPFGAGSLGLGNYVASLTTLYLIALRFGELTGRLNDAEREQLEGQLIAAGSVVGETAVRNGPIAQELASRFWHLDKFFILGGGPNYGTAQFAAAKLFEQPHLAGIPQQLEEWAHEQYFLTRPDVTPMFVLAPQGRSHDRAVEQMRGGRDMGATVVAVADSEDQEAAAASDVHMPIVGDLPEELTPLAYIVPGMLFATAMHQLTGRPPFPGVFTEDKMMEVNFRQIFHSQLKDA